MPTIWLIGSRILRGDGGLIEANTTLILENTSTVPQAIDTVVETSDCLGLALAEGDLIHSRVDRCPLLLPTALVTS